MLEVVGGTYRELCNEGGWRQLFGSGFRAAAALKNQEKVRFHTYIAEADEALLLALATTFDVTLSTTRIPRTVTFAYDHGLSIPHIFPSLEVLESAPSISVAGDFVLRFGMLEGDAEVQAGMAVYDPQSAFGPKLFRANGSTADRLVVVCNRREATLLTNVSDVVQAASQLRTLEAAEAVVIKCGSHGALLLSESGQAHVPAFQTSRVWPIGSGDVFAAALFAAWTKGESILDAATWASRATAYYCESRSLPLPLTADMPSHSPLSLRTISLGASRPLVYLAGPFFNMAERWLVNQARDALIDQGLDVFSPFHDVGIGDAMNVAPMDIEQLRKADVVLALLDGLDSGTLFEVGFARCLGTPVIGFCQNNSEESLKMLVGTECDVNDDFVTSIYKTAWAALRA